MRGEHVPLGLGLRAAVLGDGTERVGLHVRRALAAVEDDVRREVDEPAPTSNAARATFSARRP